MDHIPLLTTDQMASFVSRGFLRFDAVVPDDVNQQALEELPLLFRAWLDEFRGVTSGHVAEPDAMELPRSGTPVHEAYAPDSAFGRMVRVPVIAGAISELASISAASWPSMVRAPPWAANLVPSPWA